MKHTILDLKKKVLVVEVPEKATKWSVELIAKHKDWQQAEEKTFRNCLIFEIL